jgi:signal transduction histidine kinase
MGEDGPLAVLVHERALLDDPGLVEAAGGAARLALQNARLRAELRARLEAVRESRVRIVHAADWGRQRLERDLRDGAQQQLVNLERTLRLASDQLEGTDADARHLVASSITEAQTALEELRELARGVLPQVLTEQGLGPALRALAARALIPVEVVAAPSERMPLSVEACAYFVCSEALANTAKHARARRVTIRVESTSSDLTVEISDDGIGGATATTASGLAGITDRVEALRGVLSLESPPGQGTCVTAWIPVSVNAEIVRNDREATSTMEGAKRWQSE